MIQLLLLLFGCHAICDYVLQNKYILDGKYKHNHFLIAHCFIHAVPVTLLTCPVFGVVEFISHYLTDKAKIKGMISVNKDQFIHYFFKFLFAFIWLLIK